MKSVLFICAMLAFIPAAVAADAPATNATPAPATAPATAPAPTANNLPPAGDYQLDKAHCSVLFRVLHLGLSHYTARFTHVDAALHIDPEHPENSTVTAEIDPHSIQTDYPNPKPDFDAELQNDKWLDTGKFPMMKFHSTKVAMTGQNTATVTGDLELHGVTKPVTLDVTFNGFMHMEMGMPGDHVGFSAYGTLKRSDFGVKEGIPQPGSNMGVGDNVEIIIEAEFVKAPAGTKTEGQKK